ncbi:MAG: DNA primase [Syntrophales bacterium]|nr:DNA primase [Syntrophales bacterium]
MQGSINDGTIEEVRRRADIVSLIGEYVALRKTGKNYTGLCPFHQEKTPSFTISPEKQIFHCFGCGEHGDVFSFLMKMDGLTFPEAIRQLAGKTGVVIPERVHSREEKERYTLKEQIVRVNGLAVGFFAKTLSSQKGEKAREYLIKRGIGQSAVEQFRIGLAPEGWQGLLDFLERKGIPATLAEQAGLAIIRSGEGKGGYYDRFRGRIIIPIVDSEGRVVAFGGRVMDAGEPKYLNSPESPVYTKGNNLFGLFDAREAIRNKGFAVLVEGYFDLISLWASGIKNVVATLGTALTRSQVDLLGRYTKRVAAVFDPDEAGRKALARSMELFLAGNIQAMAVILPEGYDPDSFVRAKGRGKMEEMLAAARPMADYYIEEILGNSASLQEDREKLRSAVVFVKKIDDVVERNLFIKKVAEKLNIDQDVLKKEVGKSFSSTPAPDRSHSMTPQAGDYERLELSFIHMLFESPELVRTLGEGAIFTFFKSEDLKTVGKNLLLNSEKEGEKNLNVVSLLSGVEDERIKKNLYALMVGDNPYKGEQRERLLADTAKQIRRRWYKEQHRILKEKLARADRDGNRELCDGLLQEKERLFNEENNLD